MIFIGYVNTAIEKIYNAEGDILMCALRDHELISASLHKIIWLLAVLCIIRVSNIRRFFIT